MKHDSLVLLGRRGFCSARDAPGSLAGIRAVDVTQLTQAEAIAPRWVHVPVHGHHGAAGRHLEHLPHLNVHFKVGDRAPELRSCHENSC